MVHPKGKSMLSEGDYEIQSVVPNDKEEIIRMARQFFNKDEPLNEDIGLTGPDGHVQELEDYIVSTIDEGVSTKAVIDGDRLVGFSANGIVQKDSPCEEPSTPNDKFQIILNFLHFNTRQCNIFKRYPDADKVMMVKILSVDPIMRGKGVATQLMDKTREIAKEKGCQLLAVECTSYYSALVAKKLGLTQIYSLKFSDYKVNGKVVFTPKPPHTEYTVYVQEL